MFTKNILLLEPNAALSAIYAQALQHEGAIVVVAATAQGAIHAADRQLPDVIVLELQLAVHDGIEFLHELRSYAEWQQIPVVIITNTPLATLIPLTESLQDDLGVIQVLYKPRLTLKRFVSVIKEVVK